MSLDVTIDTSDLLRLAGVFIEKAATSNTMIAGALNIVGDQVSDQVVETVSEQTDVPVENIRGLVYISRADETNLLYNINATRALIDAPATRPMPQRGFVRRPSDYFHNAELVNIVTMGDELVCPICQDLETSGPFTIEEARAMLPVHPHCRCVVQTFRPRRSLPVQFRKVGHSVTTVVTMDQLRNVVSKEIDVWLRVRSD